METWMPKVVWAALPANKLLVTCREKYSEREVLHHEVSHITSFLEVSSRNQGEIYPEHFPWAFLQCQRWSHSRAARKVTGRLWDANTTQIVFLLIIRSVGSHTPVPWRTPQAMEGNSKWKTSCQPARGHKVETADVSKGECPSLAAIWESRNSVWLECCSGFSFQEKLQGRVTNNGTFVPVKPWGWHWQGRRCSESWSTRGAPGNPGCLFPHCSAFQSCTVG